MPKRTYQERLSEAREYLKANPSPKGKKVSPDAAPFDQEKHFVTPELAFQWLDRWPFVTNRDVRDFRVKDYADDILTGNFMQSTMDVAQLPGGSRSLANGQHRLWAVIEAGRGIWVSLNVHHVESLDEARSLYTVVDTGLTRSTNDAMRAYGLAEKLGLSTAEMNLASAALTMIMGGFEPIREIATRTLRFQQHRRMLLQEWELALHGWRDALRDQPHASRKMFSRQAVAAVILATYRHDRTDAAAWWPRVIANDALAARSPGHKLRTFLENTPATFMPAHVYSRHVAHAWNHHMKRTPSLNVLRVTTAMEQDPILLLGTPFDGKGVYTDLP